MNRLWAKSSSADGRWHPLVLHLLDVAAVADALIEREPRTTRERLAAIVGLSWAQARPWLLLLIACHDLGKGCPGFQCKWKNLSGLDAGPTPDTAINHAFVSHVELRELLMELGWPEDSAELVAGAVGCHHGERASPTTFDQLAGNRRALGKREWHAARRALFEALIAVFAPGAPPTKATLSGPDFMLLAGLTSFSDWIGSNEAYFPFGAPDDCDDPAAWFHTRRAVNAENALNQTGWLHRLPLADAPRAFDAVFGLTPRPLQHAMVEALSAIDRPAILLVEAPMGEGKTEAALYAHLELQRRLGHRGLYVALPTKATGNAMFRRVLCFLQSQRGERQLDLQLLHGGALLNDDYQQLKPGGIFDATKGGEVRASEWFTHKKRALLSEYGVGTVDQALLTILPVRHQFVRLWGLANRVVVFDEIHAYDAYTGTLLLHLLRWLLALGASVMLLSATLPPQFRRQLADLVGQKPPEDEAGYPRLSVYQPGELGRQIAFDADPARRLTVRLQPVAADLVAIKNALDTELADGGYALALTNTVQRAQDLYRNYGAGERLVREGERVGKRLPDGTEVYLFHARFPADARQRREDGVLNLFGRPDPESPAPRRGRKILIATQVAEQSLDLDFDLIATDLAPIDLLLQRAGRLWRHARGERSVAEPHLIVAGLAEEPPPSFGKPLWWSAVYREDVLLRTRSLLRGKPTLQLPDEIDTLVAKVYEEAVEVETSLEARLDRAMQDALGEEYAHIGQAHQAIIGLPDDASWKTGARFTLYDDDEPGVHASLKVRTRLGEDSVVVVPLYESDIFDPAVTPDFSQAKDWFPRAMSLSRKGIVKRLQAQGAPEGWRQSALLRNAYPLRLDAESRWIEDKSVWLSDELGLVYEQGDRMSQFNLIDEAWIPVRTLDGERRELGIRDTLLRPKEIAVIEDPSPLVTAALHRFLLAVLYRALEGPADIDQAKDWFKSGLPGEKIDAYLECWRDRFWLFDERHPFFQIPDFEPKVWRAWTVLAAEHNADNAKVLFDHIDITHPDAVLPAAAARWLLAAQTFALGGGNSDFGYTKSAPSATAAMVLPLGRQLEDTLLLNLVPQHRPVLAGDLPVWEREPESVDRLRAGAERSIAGYADRYTWRTRSIRLRSEDDGSVSTLAFASGIENARKDSIDPMFGYRIDDTNGKLPIQFRGRGLWRDFDSLLPDGAKLAPEVIEHATALARLDRARFPRSVMVLGQSNNKAKIEFWRLERFALPEALLGERSIRTEIHDLLADAEASQQALWRACKSFARDLLSRGERNPDGKDITRFAEQMPVSAAYWSALEAAFHDLLRLYTAESDPDAIRQSWLKTVRQTLRDAWQRHSASVSTSDAWAIRALVRAEAHVNRQRKALEQEIQKYETYRQAQEKSA